MACIRPSVSKSKQTAADRSEQLLPDEAVEITVSAHRLSPWHANRQAGRGGTTRADAALEKLKPGEPAEEDVVGKSQPTGPGNYKVEFVPILPAPSKSVK